jgi:SAM-dependent methyltransferase
MSSSPSFLDPVVLPLVRGSTILDVACGFGRWGCLLRTNFFEWGLSDPPVVDAVDAFAPNVEYVKRLNVYRNVWQAVLPCPLPRDTYTTILASEVLEHLPESALDQTFNELEAAALERVIVTTPNWEYLRGGSTSFLGSNEFDHHLSFVSPRSLRRRGYQIYGAGFGNPRTWSLKLVCVTLRALGVRDFSLFASLTKRFHSLAHTIVATKDCRKK